MSHQCRHTPDMDRSFVDDHEVHSKDWLHPASRHATCGTPTGTACDASRSEHLVLPILLCLNGRQWSCPAVDHLVAAPVGHRSMAGGGGLHVVELLGVLGRDESDFDEVEWADEPVADPEAAGTRHRVT